MSPNNKTIKIIGAGLAGSEAALQCAEMGYEVELFEMRPSVQTPVHESGDCAELVCSNSLKSMQETTAGGLLKKELQLLGSKLLPLAYQCQVDAGTALAVDRVKFRRLVTAKISSQANIKLHRKEITELDESPTIVATGPLTSQALTGHLLSIIGSQHLYFFDAIAPIISADSINTDIVFSKSRYDKTEAHYLNCPFEKDEYYRFVHALQAGEKYQSHEFEDRFFQSVDFKFYENCIPIEELAKRGEDTLRFGVMRPVGLEDPKTGRRPYAVIQLRAENTDTAAYNLVGCQTMLRYPEQKRVFRLIPGLEKAEFLRLGSIHRNTYLNAPEILDETLALNSKPNIRLAGQFSGLEGYVESILGGLLAAKLTTGSLPMLPETTISGQLWRHLITQKKNFQPMNANFGLLPPLEVRIRDKKEKKKRLSERSIKDLESLAKFKCS
jgi:methylenetetrahydrofolate--tRNA-(uracil-5-)-methyltransferase